MTAALSFTLTTDELAELSGWKQARRQIEWLSRVGIPFFLARDGKPRVLRSALEFKAPAETRQPRLRL